LKYQVCVNCVYKVAVLTIMDNWRETSLFGDFDLASILFDGVCDDANVVPVMLDHLDLGDRLFDASDLRGKRTRDSEMDDQVAPSKTARSNVSRQEVTAAPVVLPDFQQNTLIGLDGEYVDEARGAEPELRERFVDLLAQWRLEGRVEQRGMDGLMASIDERARWIEKVLREGFWKPGTIAVLRTLHVLLCQLKAEVHVRAADLHDHLSSPIMVMRKDGFGQPLKLGEECEFVVSLVVPQRLQDCKFQLSDVCIVGSDRETVSDLGCKWKSVVGKPVGHISLSLAKGTRQKEVFAFLSFAGGGSVTCRSELSLPTGESVACLNGISPRWGGFKQHCCSCYHQ
jgi:hypothetical protein